MAGLIARAFDWFLDRTLLRSLTPPGGVPTATGPSTPDGDAEPALPPAPAGPVVVRTQIDMVPRRDRRRSTRRFELTLQQPHDPATLTPPQRAVGQAHVEYVEQLTGGTNLLNLADVRPADPAAATLGDNLAELDDDTDALQGVLVE